jgi:hypothetical protein
LVDERFRGMSAEDIYRCMELDAKAQKEKEEKERQEREQADTDPGNGDDEGDDESDDESDDNDADDGDDEGDQGDDGDEADEGQGDDEGDDEGRGKPTGEPEADDQGDAEGEGQGGGEPSDEDAEGKGDEPVSTGDFPGSLGEVLDSADDAGEISDEDTRWEKIVRQAKSIGRGDTPGHISREIERANNPAQNWRDVLRAWIDGGTKRIETWNRPNRRFIGSGTILPGSQRDGLNRVVACIDTSGSMDDIALACVAKEVGAALDEGAIDELVVVYCDTRVTRVDTYHAGDDIEFDPRGGGGTDLMPMFKYVAENIESPSGMLVFTDLEIGDAGPAPDCPSLFAVTGYPDRVRALIAASVPWGADAIDVGSH